MSGVKGLVIILYLIAVAGNRSTAQCVNPISSFPYSETFESSNGGWVASGTASDWVWGTPLRTVINSAGQGNKCWIVGGLTGNGYNDNEYSHLQSPCFDFSALAHPQISFFLFWESELRYDGARLQYSINNGQTWNAVGNDSSNSNCLGSNWYNYNAVDFIDFSPGWSGNVQPASGSCRTGNGSGAWLRAAHDLTFLSGQPRVQFRFLFGSGRICNAFNGFAVDDILIKESPTAAAVDYTGRCVNNNTIAFSNQITLCQASVLWDFGDPRSGVFNTANTDTTRHVFSAPGEYSVTMTVTFRNGQTSTRVKQFVVLGADAALVKNPDCYGQAGGQATVTVTGGNGNYFYNWNSSPAQNTNVASNLYAGTYQVNVSAINACPANASITITQPDSIKLSVQVEDEICNNTSGNISLNISGGTPPYSFAWTNGGNTPDISNLSAGLYGVAVSDSQGCTSSFQGIEVKNVIRTAQVYLGADTFVCPGQTLVLQPGPFASYLWQDGSTGPTYSVTATGDYSVEVVDDEGCSGNSDIRITVDCSDVYFPNVFTPNGDGLNETFGPLGNIAALTKYYLRVYNRYGKLVFYGTDPNQRWKGLAFGKKADAGVFVWMSEYFLNGKYSGVRKGTVIILY